MLGRRRLFLAGLALFATASLLAGSADAYAPLLAARSLQGLGAAMLLPASLALVNTAFRGRDRAIAVVVATGLLPDRVAASLPIGLFVHGVGVGFASSQLAPVILAEIPPRDSGQASGMQSTFRQVGAAAGIAALGLVFVTAMSGYATDGLAAIEGLIDSQRAGIVESLVDSAGWYLFALRAWTPDFVVVVEAVEHAITAAARLTVFTAGAIFAAGTVVSRFLPDDLRSGSTAEADTVSD